MIRFQFLICIFSTLFLFVAAQTSTIASGSPTLTGPGTVSCETLFSKNYGYSTHCTPTPGVGDNFDDAPTIQAAFDQAWANEGFVELPEGQTFTIRSPLFFSNCSYCGIRLNSVLKIVGTEEDWKDAGAI